jgi:hypothetical protein
MEISRKRLCPQKVKPYNSKHMKDKLLQQAFSLIDKWPSLNKFVGPANKDTIKKAQDTLNVLFPPSYRAFLERYGAGGFGSVDFYGIVDNDLDYKAIPNGIWLTQDERITSRLPPYLVIIAGAEDDDGYVCLNCSDEQDKEVPVVVYFGTDSPNDFIEAETLNKSFRMAKTFSSFLLRMVQAVIDEES